MSTPGWEPVIGLEIHVQLATRTKMFCGCELSFGDPPNTHTCPICLAHPGVLPVLNAEAVRLAVITGLALGCEIAPHSQFHRKNYFYPDLSKAYQISQYDEPICVGGHVSVLLPEGEFPVGITRAHLEEDAAKLVHGGAGGRRARRRDLLGGLQPRRDPAAGDRHRARPAHLGPGGGLPATAARHPPPAGRERLQHGGGLHARGRQRERAPRRGHRARHQDRAQEHEQLPLPGAGHRRRDRPPDRASSRAAGAWSRKRCTSPPRPGEIHSLRSKEEAHDYRYLPEPDLVPVVPDRAWVEELRAGLPELPTDLRRRWTRDLGISFEDAEVLSETPELAAYFEAVAALVDPKTAANWVRGELRAQLRELGQEPWESRVTPAHLAEIIGLIDDRTLSVPLAKEVLAEVIASGAAPRDVVADKGLGQISDEGELVALVERLLEENPGQAAQLREGKDKLVGFFVGQAMKATGGRADPARVGELVRERSGL